MPGIPTVGEECEARIMLHSLLFTTYSNNATRHSVLYAQESAYL